MGLRDRSCCSIRLSSEANFSSRNSVLPADYLSRIIRVARQIRALHRTNDMADTARKKQNITISLSPEMIKKAKVLAAQRSTSISGLLAEQIESLVDAEEAYERCQRAALALLEKGFHFGGMITASRDGLHER